MVANMLWSNYQYVYKKSNPRYIIEFLIFPHRLNSNNIRFSIFSKSIIKTSKIYSKLTTEIAGSRQCRCTGIFTVTFNCLLVIIFPLNTLGIIEICQTFSSSVFFESVEAEDKAANQRDLARQTKHHVRVDAGTDELCLICIITCSNSSKLI